jgi:spermidine synthase
MPAALYAMAFASGFAALVYQVAWTKMLSLTFGGATLAVSAVVAGFLGGMGVGAWLFHKLGERIGDALRAYAGLELGIAVSTALLTALLEPLPQLFARVAGPIPPGLGYDLFRVAAVFALLFVPSALMGATYPALCSALIHTRDEVERRLGAIYGLNTVGAAAGALTCGFVLVEALGLRGSVRLANAVNLAVAAAAGALAFRFARAGRRVSPFGRDEALPTQLPYWLTAAVIVGSGFATLGYEIVWFRALRYLVGNSTFALTNVLVIFLLGLGLGALLLEPVLRLGRPERTLAWIQLGIAALALLAMNLEELVLGHPDLHRRYSIFSPLFQARPWQERLVTSSGVAFAIMFPATLLMGLVLPLASRLYLGNVRLVGRRVGSAYLFANLGSIAGAIGAAIVILPRLGTVGGTQALALLNLALGLGVLARAPGSRARWLAAGVALAALAALWAPLPERLTFQGSAVVRLLAPQLVFEEEGDLATVQVRQQVAPPRPRAMLIDGEIIAGSPALNRNLSAKQRLLAHLPKAIDGSLAHTLNVGLASGATVASLATYPDVASLDVVEINAPVKRAIRFFASASVLEDPRASLAIDDAVHYLLRSDREYDLIISDGKQNEDFSGNARMLSREFYQASLARLGGCGLFIQWIQADTHRESFEIVLRTFLSVFPEVEVFFDPPGHVFMVGSRCPLPGRPRLDAESFRRLPVSGEMTGFGYASPDDLVASWVASGAQIAARLPPGPTNTNDRMLLEYLSYRASRESFEPSFAANLRFLLAAGRDGPSPARAAFTPDGAPAVKRLRTLSEAVLEALEGNPRAGVRRLEALVREHPGDTTAQEILAQLRARANAPPH